MPGRHKKDCTCNTCTERIKRQYFERFGEPEPTPTPEAPKAPEAPEAPPPEITPTERQIAPPPEAEAVEVMNADFFGDMLNDYNNNVITVESTEEEAEAEEEPRQTSTTQIKGATVLLVVDLFAPPLLAKLYNYLFKPKKQIHYKDLKLTSEEKEELIELADAAFEDAGIELSPMNAFLSTLAIVYTTKIFTHE